MKPALDPEEDRKAKRIASDISRAIALNAKLLTDGEELAKIKVRLLRELPPGNYADGALTIVSPGTAIKPGAEQVAAARLVAGKLAAKLFKRQIVYKPVDKLRDIARAILKPALAEKVIRLCEVPTSGQVRFR